MLINPCEPRSGGVGNFPEEVDPGHCEAGAVLVLMAAVDSLIFVGFSVANLICDILVQSVLQLDESVLLLLLKLEETLEFALSFGVWASHRKRRLGKTAHFLSHTFSPFSSLLLPILSPPLSPPFFSLFHGIPISLPTNGHFLSHLLFPFLSRTGVELASPACLRHGVVLMVQRV